jgi:DNA-binding transcriptional LysR family regulator
MRLGSQAAAADSLGISQPAISKVISFIERRSGVILFARGPGRLRPTEDANLLFKSVEDIFERVLATERVVDDLRYKRASEICVAFPPGIGHDIIRNILGRFTAAAPKARLRFKLLPLGIIADRLVNKQVDIGVFDGFIDDISLKSLVIKEKDVVCVLPPNHRFCNQSAITPEMLAGERIISSRAQGRRSWPDSIESAFRDADQEFDVAVECIHAFHAYEMARAGLGIALIPRLLQSNTNGADVVERPFAPRVRAPFGVLMLRDYAPTMTALNFIEAVREGARAFN